MTHIWCCLGCCGVVGWWLNNSIDESQDIFEDADNDIDDDNDNEDDSFLLNKGFEH